MVHLEVPSDLKISRMEEKLLQMKNCEKIKCEENV